MQRRQTLRKVPDFPRQALIAADVRTEAGGESLLASLPGLTGG